MPERAFCNVDYCTDAGMMPMPIPSAGVELEMTARRKDHTVRQDYFYEVRVYKNWVQTPVPHLTLSYYWCRDINNSTSPKGEDLTAGLNCSYLSLDDEEWNKGKPSLNFAQAHACFPTGEVIWKRQDGD